MQEAKNLVSLIITNKNDRPYLINCLKISVNFIRVAELLGTAYES